MGETRRREVAYTPVKPGTSKKMPRQHPAEQWEGHVGCVCVEKSRHRRTQRAATWWWNPRNWSHKLPGTAAGLFTGNHSCV